MLLGIGAGVSGIGMCGRRWAVRVLGLGELVLEVADDVHGLLDRAVVLFQLANQLGVDAQKLSVLLLDPIGALGLAAHRFQLPLQLRRLLTSVVQLQLEGEVLLVEPVQLVVHVAHT